MSTNVIASKKLWILGLLLVLGAAVAAYASADRVRPAAERADCPGKMFCPLTGEEVCKDRCPLVDASRADCPGKVECPLTGDLVCRDRCPLGAGENAAEAEDELPPCCRAKQ